MRKCVILMAFFAISILGCRKKYIVTDKEILMRKEPYQESKIIGLLSAGVKVRIIDKKGEWVKVQLPEVWIKLTQ